MAIDPFFGSVLGAGANLLGGFLGGGSARRANNLARDQYEQQFAFQKSLAHHGIRARANDAMRAYGETGIHPLALLGVQGPTYSPSSSVFTPSPMGEAVGRAGQDISRGIHATADRELRAAAVKVQEAQLKMSVERSALENELLRTQIASQRQRLAQMSGPAMPGPRSRYLVDGQGSAGLIKEEPMTRVNPAPGNPGYEPGARPGVGVLRMPDGKLMYTKSKDASELLEDDIPGNLKHFLIRTLGPLFNPSQFQPPQAPPKGYHWRSDWKGDYYLAKDNPHKGVPYFIGRRWMKQRSK